MPIHFTVGAGLAGDGARSGPGFNAATWTLSPIKFQADMGILLAFMFIWNMLGALILTPALARLLLSPGTPQAV